MLRTDDTQADPHPSYQYKAHIYTHMPLLCPAALRVPKVKTRPFRTHVHTRMQQGAPSYADSIWFHVTAMESLTQCVPEPPDPPPGNIRGQTGWTMIRVETYTHTHTIGSLRSLYTLLFSVSCIWIVS